MDLRYNREVDIPVGKVTLHGQLIIPSKAGSIVVFAHGSGSSRFSRRNQQVAQYLHFKKIGTLLFDLLTKEEDEEYLNRFDINLLAGRLIGAIAWLKNVPEAGECCFGFFGASTGAAAALEAAARLQETGAVVSRGGRPDLVNDILPGVKAPTLLIVGSRDTDVLQLNQESYEKLQCKKKLEVVEGATHLFEEAGKMEIVSKLAADWFEKYLTPIHDHAGRTWLL